LIDGISQLRFHPVNEQGCVQLADSEGTPIQNSRMAIDFFLNPAEELVGFDVVEIPDIESLAGNTALASLDTPGHPDPDSDEEDDYCRPSISRTEARRYVHDLDRYIFGLQEQAGPSSSKKLQCQWEEFVKVLDEAHFSTMHQLKITEIFAPERNFLTDVIERFLHVSFFPP
jgi:hypothetical protein